MFYCPNDGTSLTDFGGGYTTVCPTCRYSVSPPTTVATVPQAISGGINMFFALISMFFGGVLFLGGFAMMPSGIFLSAIGGVMAYGGFRAYKDLMSVL